MIVLQAVARAFVGAAVEVTQANVRRNVDAPAVGAAHNTGQPNREDALRTWLGSYAAFQGFAEADRRKVVDGMLNFADAEGCHFDALSYDALIEKFHRLHGICGKAVPLTKASKERSLISLTSKGLWCCYPNSVPIYDRYVQNALWIICKVVKLRPGNSVINDRYAAFADVWLKIYEEVEPIVTEHADKIGYPYKVRIFDRILWLIGQPNYFGNVTPLMH